MVITEASVFDIIQDTWTSTLGFQVDYLESQDFSAVGAFTASVKISGAWDGEVRLHCPPPLARLIAGAIFQVEPDKAGNDETLDALGELIHIIGGNLKALLPQPVTVSLPSLVDPMDSLQTTLRRQMVTELTLMSEGHPFMVTIMGDMPDATPAD
jgi:chemotaxis protein CheX